jgi:hypothetical protein
MENRKHRDSVAASHPARASAGLTTAKRLQDNREAAVSLGSLKDAALNSPRQLQLGAWQRSMNSGARNVPARLQPVIRGKGAAVAQLGKQTGTPNAQHEEKIRKLEATIQAANDKIAAFNKQNNSSDDDSFITDSSFTPMNPATYFASMGETDSAHMSLEQTRLAAISDLSRAAMNQGVSTKRTPEAQTAMVSQGGNQFVYMSGNTEKGNAHIRPKQDKKFGDFYIDTIRPINIGRRSEALYMHARQLRKNPKKQRLLINKVRASKGFKSLAGMDDDVREAHAGLLVAHHLLKENKNSPARKRATSARKFGKAQANSLMRVPSNQKNIHAESAILRELESVNATLEEIGGTKVACLACQAYFTHRHQEQHLGDVTGYAWISESSITQLASIIASVTSAEKYLAAIQKTLKARLKDLKRFTGRGGEKKVSDMTLESDHSDTDSEDEEAMWNAIENNDVRAIAGML